VLSRNDSVIVNRLSIGHTRLTHSYLLSGEEDQPKCNTCQCPLTVKHVLLECTDFSDVRQKYFSVASVKDLFDNVVIHNIVAFVKEIHF